MTDVTSSPSPEAVPPVPSRRQPLRPTWASFRLPVVAAQGCVAAGVLLLAYTGAQIWGSNLVEADAQRDLAQEWRPARDNPVVATVDVAVNLTPPARTVATTPEPAPVAAAPGDPIARLEIPTIGLDKTVVFGTDREALQTGPGLYPSTAWPGRSGNVAIAGHRTTYGAPFQRIDELQPGHEIIVTTDEGRFVYVVRSPGHEIVTPEDVSVLADSGDNRLTLTSCHPLYSARQRIVVTAALTTTPADALPQATEPAVIVPVRADLPNRPVSLAGLRAATHPELLAMASPERSTEAPLSPWLQVARWVLTTLAILGAVQMIERRWRRWPTRAVAVPPLAMSLVSLFIHLDQALPFG